MNESEIRRLEIHAPITARQKEMLAAVDVDAEPCVYLLPAKKNDNTVGWAGGWPKMPTDMEWPRDEKGYFPFLAWIDLDQVSAQLEDFGATGQWLLFESPLTADPVAANIIAGDVEVNERKTTENDCWSGQSLVDLADGQPYEATALTLVKGVSVNFDDNIVDEYWNTLESTVPEESVGQIGGFVGPCDGVERAEVCLALHGHDALNEFDGRYANVDPDELPEPIETGKEPRPDINLNPIVDRYVGIGKFFEDNTPLWQKRAKEKQKEWPKTVSASVNKVIKGIAEKERSARTDFRVLSEMISAVTKPLDRLTSCSDGVTEFAIEWIKSTPGYGGWINMPKSSKGPVHQKLCEISDKLIVVDRDSGSQECNRLVQKAVDLLGECGKEYGWFNWVFFANNCLRILHNQNTAFHREQARMPDAETMKKIRAGLVWKKGLKRGQLEAESREVKLALALGEASNWCWGDCAHRRYFVMGPQLKMGDLSRVVVSLDGS